MTDRRWTAPRLGIVCGLAAASIGFSYLVAAGAPAGYWAIQAAALAIGLVSIPILRLLTLRSPRNGSQIVLILLAAALLLTFLFGLEASGATRWVRLGAVNLQPSLVLLPAMLLLYARSPGPVGTVAMALAGLALAIQPDRAMAGALAVSLALLALWRRDRFTIAAAASAGAAFAVTLALPDSLPAVPFVDLVLYSAFDVHPLIGLAVVAGSILLLVPVLGAGDPMERLVFGAVWLAIITAAALGHYPTPVVGYGGSALLGYWLSVALLSGRARHGVGDQASPAASEPMPGEPLLRASA